MNVRSTRPFLLLLTLSLLYRLLFFRADFLADHHNNSRPPSSNVMINIITAARIHLDDDRDPNDHGPSSSQIKKLEVSDDRDHEKTSEAPSVDFSRLHDDDASGDDDRRPVRTNTVGDKAWRLREDFPPSVTVTSQRRMLRRGIAAQGGYALCSERGHNGTAGCDHPCGPKHPECVGGCLCPFPKCLIIDDSPAADTETMSEPGSEVTTLKCVMNPYDAAIPPSPFNGLVCGDDSWRVYPPRPAAAAAAANGTSAPRHRRAASFTTARERLMGTDDPETGESFRDPLPPMSGSDGVEDTAAPFKRLTAWMFPAWKDYPAMSRNATLQWEARFTKEETRPSVEWDTPHGNRTWGEYTSYFDANGDYVIEFGCLHAMGGLSGVNPSVAAFDGMDEVWAESSKRFRPFFETVHPHQGAPIRPEEFLDVDLLLMPVYYRSSNNVHAFNRVAAAAMLDRFHFQSRFGRRAMKPGRPYDAVAVARAMIQALPDVLKHGDVNASARVPNGGGMNADSNVDLREGLLNFHKSKSTSQRNDDDDDLDRGGEFRSPVTRKPSYRPTIAAYILTSNYPRESDTYRAFQPLLSDAWIGIIGMNYTAEDLITEARKERRFRLLLQQNGVNVDEYQRGNPIERDAMMKKVEELREKMRSTRMCFRKAVVSYQSRAGESKHKMRDAPGRRYRLGYVDHRTEMEWSVATMMRRRALTCLEVQGRDKRKALVIHSYRTTKRRIPQISRLIPKLAATALLGLSNGTIPASMFVTIENNRITFNANYIMFLQADVLIGSFGAGLGWVYFMRPGAALVEVTTKGYGCPQQMSKVSAWFKPSRCEYGGYAVAARLVYFGSIVPVAFPSASIAINVFTGLLQRGLCAVEDVKNRTIAVGNVPEDNATVPPLLLPVHSVLDAVSVYLPQYDDHRSVVVPWLLDEAVDVWLEQLRKVPSHHRQYFIESFRMQQRTAMSLTLKRTMDVEPRVLQDDVLRGWFQSETEFCERRSANIDPYVPRR